MARSIEAKLHALHRDPSAAEVEQALHAKVGVLVEAAVPHAMAHGLLDELAPAFERMCEDGAKRDPLCRAKLAIARTLQELEQWDDRVFARGVTYEQIEGSYPEPIDAAPELRGLCGMAYAYFGQADALDVLATLLADPEVAARIGAVRGLGGAGRIDASALLRYKLLTGDPEPDVIATAFEALLGLQGEGARAFVEHFLDDHDDMSELAVIALATSRFDDLLPRIQAWCDGALGEPRRRVGYVALALLRDDRATARLVEVIATGSRADAIAAGKALATFKADPNIRNQLEAACDRQRDKQVRSELQKVLAR